MENKKKFDSCLQSIKELWGITFRIWRTSSHLAFIHPGSKPKKKIDSWEGCANLNFQIKYLDPHPYVVIVSPPSAPSLPIKNTGTSYLPIIHSYRYLFMVTRGRYRSKCLLCTSTVQYYVGANLSAIHQSIDKNNLSEMFHPKLITPQLFSTKLQNSSKKTT